MSLTIRKDGNAWTLEGETSEPALAAGTKVSASLELDVRGASQLPVRNLDEMRAYGRMLGESVFAGAILARFNKVLDRVPHDDVLHVSLSVEDIELRSLRWERLCCPLDDEKNGPWEFLHLRQETAFSLDLRSANDRRYPAISRVGLKALVVVADMGPTRPYKLADFNAADTVAGIRAALGKDIVCHVLASSGESQLPNTDGLPTLDEICRSLSRERFAILHLVCHGEFKQWEEPGPNEKPVSKSDTFLYLRKPGEIDPTRKDDHVARVSGTVFLQRLRQLQALPHLTFLCSCSSASAEAEQGLGGLGQRLVRELAMPAVVAMTEPVPIDLANEISTEFYNHLRQTGEVDRALTKASASQAGRPAILVPTHFSRLAGRRLFDDSLELTTAEWEHGLNRLPALIQERAPVLVATFDKLLKVVQPALEIWKVGELSTSEKRTADETRARDTLLLLKAELNELCQDFVENSFDHLAKGKELDFPIYDGRCPFPGLGVFDKVKTGDKEEDFRPFFFGRDLLISEIRELLIRNRFLAVLGGSGSGKSSLIRAGLLKGLRREKPELQDIVYPPGKDPLARLQTELAASPNPDILVVDQFEELFTLCADLTQRKEFLKQLLPLKDRIPIVITMRADFLGECAGHDELHQLLDAADDKHLKLIQPLKGNELRSVVELQAQAVGLKFEPGLAATIFDDLEGEPGAMPLLQHCLRQLWQYRHGRWLRLAEYANEDRVGGVKGAIARTAEDVYQQLVKDEPEASTLLPFIFERLARIDTTATDPEQRRDTRRREELTELTPAGSDAQVVKRIVTKLADAKLVVTTQNPQTHETEVEIAHEALIRNWPRLQKWLDAARDTARLVERIRSDADTYRSTPSPDNLTLRGAVLVEAEALIPAVPRRLNEPEEQFVRDCRKHENAMKDAKDRLRTRIIIGLACGLVIAIGLGTYSYLQRDRALALAKTNGELAKSNGDLAVRNGDLAADAQETNRRLFRVSQNQLREISRPLLSAYPHTEVLPWTAAALRNETDPDLIHGLRSQLMSVIEHSPTPRLEYLRSDIGTVSRWSWSVDGATTVFADTNAWTLLDGHSGTRRHATVMTSELRAIAVSPDGLYVAIADRGSQVQLRDGKTGKFLKRFATGREVTHLAWHPNSKWLAVLESTPARLHILKVDDLHPVTKDLTLNGKAMALQFDHSGEFLLAAVGQSIKTFGVTGSADGAKVSLDELGLAEMSGGVKSVVFHPNENRFAATNGTIIELWPITTQPSDGRKSQWFRAVGAEFLHFDPSGEYVFAGGNNRASVWPKNVFEKELPPEQKLEGLNGVRHAEFSTDGRQLLTVSKDGELAVWQTSSWKRLTSRLPHRREITLAGFRPEGHRIWSLTSNIETTFPEKAPNWPIEFIQVENGKIESFQVDKVAQCVGLIAGDPVSLFSSSRGNNSKSFFEMVNLKTKTRTLEFDAPVGTTFMRAGPDRLISTRSHFADLKATTIIQVWDADKGTPLSPEISYSGFLPFVSLNAEGTLLVSVTSPELGESEVRLRGWSIPSGNELYSLKISEGLIPVVAAQNGVGDRIALSTSKGIQLFDTQTGEALSTLLPTTARATRLSFDEAGKRLLVVTEDEAHVVDIDTGTVHRLEEIEQVFQCQLSPDGKWAAIGESGLESKGIVKIYEVESGKAKHRLRSAGTPHGFHFGPDSSKVLVINGGDPNWQGINELYCWTLAATGSSPKVLPNVKPVSVASYQPGTQLVVVGRNDFSLFQRNHYIGEDGSISLWNSVSGEIVSLPTPIPFDPADVVFNDDQTGAIAVSGLLCPRPHAMQLDSARLTTTSSHPFNQNKRLDRGSAHSSGFVALLSSSADGVTPQLNVWDLKTGNPRFSKEVDRNGKSLKLVTRGAVCSRDGKWVAVAVDDRICLFDSKTGELGNCFQCPIPKTGFSEWDVHRVGFSPDSKLVIATATSNLQSLPSAFVWDIGKAGPPKGPFSHNGMITSTAINSTNKRLATGGEDGVGIIWDLESAEQTASPLSHSEAITWIEFSPDDRFVATASKDKTSRIWEAETGFPVTPTMAHSTDVSSCQFRSDGKQLLTVAGSNVLLWPLSIPSLPSSDFASLGELLSGYRVASGRLVPIEFDEWLNEWERLKTVYPEEFTPSLDKVNVWHSAAAWELFSTEKFSAAREHVDSQLAHSAPRNWQLDVQRGLINQHLEDLGEAIRDYERAINEGADVWAVHWQLGEMLLGQKPPDVARADQEFTLALKQNPKSADLAARIAQAWRKAGHDEKALENFDACLQLDPKFLDAQLGKADIIVQKEPETAVKLTTEALQQRKESWLAMLIRGVALRILKKDDDALQDFTTAVTLSEGAQEALQQLGDLQLDRNQIQEAEATWIRYTENDPRDWYGWQQRGRAEGIQNKWWQANQSFKNAYDRYKERPEARSDDKPNAELSWFFGLSQQEISRHDLARPLLIEANQNGKECWADLARSAYLLHLFKESEQEYQQEINKDPKNRMAWYWLGATRVEQGKLQESLDAFREARKLDDRDLFAFQALAFMEIARQLDTAKVTCRDLWTAHHAANPLVVLEPLISAPDLIPDLTMSLADLDQAIATAQPFQKYNLLRLKVGVLYRAAEFDVALQVADEALKAHEESVKSFGVPDPRPVFDEQWGGPGLWLMMALSYAGLDNKVEAKRWYERSQLAIGSAKLLEEKAKESAASNSPKEAVLARQEELLQKLSKDVVHPDTWQTRLQLQLLRNEIQRAIGAP